MNKVMTYAKGIHSVVGMYVAQCLQEADECFTKRKRVPEVRIHPEWVEVDHKLVAVCLEALPDRLSSDCYRQGRNDSFTLVLYNIFTLINPGGSREIDCLTQFVRRPVGPSDAAGVREVLEDWVVARRRLKAIGNLEMIPKERFDAMSLMVEALCKRDYKFRKIWDTKSAMLGPGYHDHVNDQFANETENWLRHELKGMESNDLMEQPKDQVGSYNRVNQYGANVNMAAVPSQGPNQQEDKRNNFVCYNWKKDGKCSRKGLPIFP